MVRAKRGQHFQRLKKEEQYHEDDPEAYKNMPVPDKMSSQYTKDTVDEFHEAQIAKLLASGVHMESDEEDLDDEEEVMALETDDDDDDDDDDIEEEENEDMDSDLEGKKDDELPNDLAWGTKKRIFYDSDYVAAKGKTKKELEEEEQEEEEEAKNIQNRLTENLTEEDYDLNFFQEFAAAAEEKNKEKVVQKEERIVKDLKQMSKKEKMKLLRKESPELLELIQDFKAKLTEMKDELQPLMQMVKDGKIPPGKGADYLETKQQLYLNYCTNISFYLVLKAKRIPAHNHPVIERLLTYRNLINRLSAVDARLAPQLRKLLAAEDEDEPTSRPTLKKKAGVSTKDMDSGKAAPEEAAADSDLDEEAALLFYRQVEERINLKKKMKENRANDCRVEEHVDATEEMDAETKRGITYQMSKNKGLTPKRKKIDRNPRVKHREKFRRAKIRRKGQVREVRREEMRYSGELSGIRAGVKKSIKLK
ncbi:something about silencing protein 10 [Nerophis ophidion]|uniref:something about silencing protein 10 n=1 Tax=Nerophis ophidion TaxID=159077 RepID=UPI002ADF310E|nr:something about silencing protein 10 [Nerophis ophidion]